MPLSTDLSLGSLRGTIAGIVDKFICDFGVESVTACCWDWIGFSGGLGASAAETCGEVLTGGGTGMLTSGQSFPFLTASLIIFGF